MDPILDLGVQIVLWLQGLGAWLEAPMAFFSFLGNEQFFLFFMPVVYWCGDLGLGVRVAVLLLFSSSVNHFFKLAIHGPRPYWYDPSVRALVIESSFGAPSNHAQTALAVWGGIAAWIKHRWAWVAAGALVFLISLSRLYNGVHFPSDVIIGWILGAMVLWIVLKAEKPVITWLQQRRLGERIAAVFAFSLALIGLNALIQLSLSAWTMPSLWLANAAGADGEPLNPLSLQGAFTNAGALFGLSAGVLCLPLIGGFDPGGASWKRLVRFLVGLAGVAALYAGLKVIFPDGDTLVALAFRYLRYALIGLWMAIGAPWVFKRLQLAGNPPVESTLGSLAPIERQ